MFNESYSFDPGLHKYLAGDREMTGVTTILRETRLYSDYKFLDRKYRLRGKAVHEAARLYDIGEYDEERTHPEIQPYLRSFQKFVEDTRFKGIAWEVGMIHGVMGVGGMLDTIGRMFDDPEIYLIDIKSGTCPERVGVQVYGYEDLLKRGSLIPNPNLDKEALAVIGGIRKGELKIRRRSLQLTPERYTLRAHDSKEEPDNPAMWMTAVSMFNTWKKHGLL